MFPQGYRNSRYVEAKGGRRSADALRSMGIQEFTIARYISRICYMNPVRGTPSFIDDVLSYASPCIGH